MLLHESERVYIEGMNERMVDTEVAMLLVHCSGWWSWLSAGQYSRQQGNA